MKNEHRGNNTNVSYPQYVRVIVSVYVIELHKDYVKVCKVRVISEIRCFVLLLFKLMFLFSLSFFVNDNNTLSTFAVGQMWNVVICDRISVVCRY